MLKELDFKELVGVNGGHDGTAYEVGHAIGTAIRKVGTIMAVVCLFFAPKS